MKNLGWVPDWLFPEKPIHWQNLTSMVSESLSQSYPIIYYPRILPMKPISCLPITAASHGTPGAAPVRRAPLTSRASCRRWLPGGYKPHWSTVSDWEAPPVPPKKVTRPGRLTACYENSHRNSVFTHRTWCLSIVMPTFTRAYLFQKACVVNRSRNGESINCGEHFLYHNPQAVGVWSTCQEMALVQVMVSLEILRLVGWFLDHFLITGDTYGGFHWFVGTPKSSIYGGTPFYGTPHSLWIYVALGEISGAICNPSAAFQWPDGPCWSKADDNAAV